MFKKLNKVLGSFGQKQTAQESKDRGVPESLSAEIPGNMIAESANGQLFAGISEISDYVFFELIALIDTKMKTFDGAVLKFTGAQGDFELTSDTQEIDFDHTKFPGWYISQISFDVTQQELDRIRSAGFEAVQLHWKKKSLHFKRAEIIIDEEE